MLELAGLAMISMILVMAAAWAVQRRTHNAGWVDAFWSLGTGVTGAACALLPLPGAGGHGPGARALLVSALALLWSGRLGLYIVRRTAAGGREDARYARFRAEWGASFEARLFGLLMIQAAVAALLAVCVMLAARNPVQGVRPLDVAAALLLAGAVAGEAVADAQMHRFRSAGGAPGRICDLGLWGWSRHPNYFFECLAWCAYPLFAFDPGLTWPPGLFAIAGPAAMIWLLTRVSGIPPLEREMVASRADAYRDYQARVSAFVPLPPRRRAAAPAAR